MEKYLNISLVSRQMLAESVPISVPEQWKILLDDVWHREYSDYCPVCRSFPCEYKE